MRYIVFFVIIGMFVFGNAKGQTGFHTTNPTTRLQIDAGKDNAATPTPAQLKNDVFVDDMGRMGVGVPNPTVKLDLRSGTDTGIVGVGGTTQAAAAAGPGAVRYSSSSGILQYSDGVAWHDLANTPPPKAILLATKSTAQTVVQTNTTQYITDWAVTSNSGGGTFTSGTGTFAVPRDGFYMVSFSITLASGAIANNSRFETIIESNQTTENNASFINVNTYPAFQTGTQNNQVSGNCSGIFNLKAGDTIRFRVWHNLGGNRSVLNNAQYNSISIYEL